MATASAAPATTGTQTVGDTKTNVTTQDNNTNNNVTPPVTPAKSTNKKNTARKNSTLSAGKRKRKKNAQKPPDFENWAEEYKKSYEMVSQLMREWKATQKQCEPIITIVSRFKVFTKRNKDYASELAAYEQSKEKIPTIGKEETFDWERT